VADKNEADIKDLRNKLDALSRRVDALDKGSKSGPDPALAKLTSRLDALEKTVANKKDVKPEHEQAIKAAMKQANEAQSQAKEFATKAQLDARLAVLEGKVNAALAKR
jgi:chromosome segregation ATPase